MKKSVWILALVCGLSGCLTNSDKSSKWSGNVQEWNFLSSITSTQLKIDGGHCDEDYNPKPIKYRVRGDSLDLGWWFTPVNEDFEVVDTFYFGGTYVRTTGGKSVQGGWKLVTHRPWDSHSAASEQVQDEIAKWNFLFADEEVFIDPKIMLFAYPRFSLYSTRLAEYEQRDDSSVEFQYVGKDSLRIIRPGETVGLKYKAFDFFHARSSSSAHSPVSVSLVDSCSYAGTAIDTTWVSDFLSGAEDEVEKHSTSKSARAGFTSRSRRTR